MSEPAVTAHPAESRFIGTGLVCERGERRVFSGLDFDIGDGGALAVIGPNGTGKSSLLRLLAGLLPSAGGTLTWNSAPVADDPDLHHGRLHYLGHLDALKPALTPAESLGFHARLRGASIATGRVAAALDAFGLARLADLPARFLSQGQRRRAALARLLIAPAPLWLLDEPTLGLDADSVGRLENAVAVHRAAGGMVIAATHGGLDLGAHDILDLRRVS